MPENAPETVAVPPAFRRRRVTRTAAVHSQLPGGGAGVENRRAECGAVGVGRHERGGEARRRWACSGWQTGQSLGGVRARGARSGRGGGVARGKWVCMCVDIEFTT